VLQSIRNLHIWTGQHNRITVLVVLKSNLCSWLGTTSLLCSIISQFESWYSF